MRTTTRGVLAVGLAAVLGATAVPADALDHVNSRWLRANVTVNGILGHERVLQRIANQNGGTRASGTPGYDASVEYVADRLDDAGYDVTVQEFTFPFFRELSPGVTAQVTPTAKPYPTQTFPYSASGDVTGVLVPTNDIVIPPTPTPSSTSGCEAADFPPAPAEPAVALVQRGTCTIEIKVNNAKAAGYDAVVVFNEGNPGRTDVITNVTLGNPQTVPVNGISFAAGEELYQATQAGRVTVRVVAKTEIDLERETYNVIADGPAGRQDGTVVVGAHLDSVIEGPGINDNGSGVATILEIAEEMAKIGYPDRLQRRVRFAFWGAEESGLLGSEHYVDTLPAAELSEIYANLNFDMVGSPNYVRFVYDGDGSATSPAGPAGSGQIEKVFTDFFAAARLASEPTQFSGRSDYGPFIAVGIPAGGLFSGAEGVKTAEQAATYGGTAGVAYDACYHRACDTISNVNVRALHELGDAAAHAVVTLTASRTGLFPDGRSAVGKGERQGVTIRSDYQGHALTR